MKVGNQTIFMGNTERSERHQMSMSERKAGEEKKGMVIFGGEFNQKLDPIAQKKKEAREKAFKIVGDAFAGDRKIDDDIEKRRLKIEELKGEIGKSRDEISAIAQQREELKDAYGLSEEDEEQKELRLLEKKAEAKKPGSGVHLTKEERQEIKRIEERGLTEYQQRSMELNESADDYENEIAKTEERIRAENAVIRDTKLERLKYHTMTDAEKQADAVMEKASDEIVGMLMEEAKDHVDKETEEEKEAAEEKAKEKKEQEEKLESAKEEKKQKEKFSEEIGETTRQLTTLDEVKTDVLEEVQKILDKMKLLEEDIKGAAVDTAG